MQQANIIHIMITNMNHNRSTALEWSVKNYWGLNRFYGIPTSPSASVMAQNIQLFGPSEGFLINGSSGETDKSQANTMMKQRWGRDRNNVLWPTPRTLEQKKTNSWSKSALRNWTFNCKIRYSYSYRWLYKLFKRLIYILDKIETLHVNFLYKFES